MKNGWQIAMLMLFLLLAACQGKDPRALKVASNQWPGYEPLYLARYLNAFQTNIDIVQLASATDVMRAFRGGSVDVAAMTLDEALLLCSQGEDLVVLMALNFSHGADAVLAWPDIDALADIRGKRVGAENTGVGAIMLSVALDKAGLAIGDIELVSVAQDQHENAFRSHSVDVIVTFEPVLTRLQNEGALRLLDSSAVPDLIVDVLVTHRSSLTDHSEQLQDLVRGYYHARNHMVTHPTESHAYIARRLKLTPLELQRALGGLRLPSLNDNIRWLSGNPSPYQLATLTLRRMMQERGLLAGGAAELPADARWLQAAQP